MRRLAAIAIVIAGQSLLAQQLPDGPGAAIVKSRCVVCHEADIITSQRMSLTGWTNSINKMVRWGSQITPEEREVLQPYLVAHFGPKLAPSHALPEPVLTTYRRACTPCHDSDIVEQQRLSKTGWTREVEKMMRWGAALTEADKTALIDYLAVRFPAR